MSKSLNPVLGISGQGQLYQTIQSYLAQVYETLPIALESPASQIASCSLVVACSDLEFTEAFHQLNQRCLQSGVAMLPAYTYFSTGIIGPCVLPHMAGCTACASQRRLGAIWDDSEHELLRQHSMLPYNVARCQPWLTTWSVEILAQLALTEIEAYLHTPEQLHTRQALIYLALDTVQSSVHHFLPVSDCAECGSKQPDTLEQATITLQSRIKPGPFSYHIRNLGDSINELLTMYVDAYTGVIGRVIPRHLCVQPHTSAFSRDRLPHHEHWRYLPSMGTATRWDQSMAVAILEALERRAGQYSRKKDVAIQASYQQLNTPALDPTTLGLHSPDQYNQPDFAFVPYHHNLITNWVWGYSFQQQQPLLIPETCVYYGIIGERKQKDAFVYEVSNGCSLGSNIEEAILYGILEVMERDAFLLTWYAQLPLVRLDLMSVTNPVLRLLIKRFEHVSGYTLRAFNATLDHAVPCLWVMAVDEQQRPNTPKMICTGGSHPHPEQALTRALQELTGMLELLPDTETFAQEKEHLLKMFHDPFKVRQMEDHTRLYWLPEAFERLAFLSHSPRQQSFQEAFSDFYCQPPLRQDLREDLNVIIDHYLQRGIDILVVDQTTSEQELHNLCCVKILMPGTLSMTFGHANRRTFACQRLYQLPYTLGYCERPLTNVDINPHPHPFP